jgi:hypothetical protein
MRWIIKRPIKVYKKIRSSIRDIIINLKENKFISMVAAMNYKREKASN